MQVTSDCLFHFTKTLSSLKGILADKFRVHYCREEYKLSGKKFVHYYPMVSFCDIPLALAKDQIGRYGCYAIGLTKEWGVKNGLNPVVYLESNSLLANDIQETTRTNKVLVDYIIKKLRDLESFTKSPKSVGKEDGGVIETQSPKTIGEARSRLSILAEFLDLLGPASSSTFSIFRYIKNYQGELSRKGKKNSKYRFYDEREWRYVPSVSSGVNTQLKPDEYDKLKGTMGIKPFIQDLTLSFKSEDVKYLIVNSSTDIPKLIKVIHNTDHLVSNSNQADILTTKILTVEQIRNDF